MSNPAQYDEDMLETISDMISNGTEKSAESWVEGKTLTVILEEEGERRFVKLRISRVTFKPSAADMRGTPE